MTDHLPAAPRWQITDEALALLDRELAATAPERGAALVAAADSRLVVDAVVDPVPGGHASYWHSAELNERLNGLLVDDPSLRYVGTAHSHPSSMAWPSAPDHAAFAASVRASGLDSGLFPIVVAENEGRLRMPQVYGEQHLVSLPHGTLAPYSWRAGRGLDSCRVSVLPLRASLTAALGAVADVAALFAGPTRVVAGVGTAWLLVPVTGDVSLDLLVPQSYPESAPLIRTAGGAFVAPRWELDSPLEDRWETALREIVAGTARASVASVARAGIRARLGYHLQESAPPHHVAVLGCGSVGSTIADLLVRSGVRALTLVDPDTVSPENLSRSVYATSDVGQPKAKALARRLSAIAPDLEVTSVVDSLGASAEECLRGVDLAVMATDDPSAEAWHSHVLYFLGTPHVSAKLFAKADAGEITLVVPAEGTACLACATGMVADSCRRGDANYGTGRLDGEPALGPDIVAVSARAARVALAALHRHEPGPLADWLTPLLSDGRTLNLSCAVADWGIFGEVAVAPMDGPFASLWVRTAPRPTCSVCGAERLAPMAPVDEVDLPDDLDAMLAQSGADDEDAPAAVMGTVEG